MLGTKVLNYNIHGYRYPLFLSAFSTSWSMFEKGFLQNVRHNLQEIAGIIFQTGSGNISQGVYNYEEPGRQL